MMHKNRAYVVSPINSPEDLADKLTKYDWCGCNGFQLGDYLFLNDSTSVDGAQEYAIVKKSTMVQIESITFSWLEYTDVLRYINKILNGFFDGENFGEIENKIQSLVEHKTCHLCA